MPSHESERPAKLARLEELHGRAELSDRAMERLRRWLVQPSQLARWLDQGLLFLGIALALAGVVFFFAYNWEGMPRLVKLGLVEAGIVAATIVAAISGLGALRGKLALLVASVLIGVFLAVFGQIYQTGADAWELFAGWTALMLPWVLLSRFQALWGIALTVVHAAALLYFQQVLGPGKIAAAETVMVALSAFNLGLLGLREVALERGARWLEPLWGRRLLVALITFGVTAPFCAHVAFPKEVEGSTVLVVLSFSVLMASAASLLWTRARDVGALALVGLGAIAAGFALLGKPLVELLDEWALFPLGLYTLAAFGGLVLGLKRLHRRLDEAHLEEARQ